MAATDSKELPLIAEALTFQDQINQSIAFLPTITAQDETNPLLVSDLSALYTNELNLDNIVVNLGEQLANGSPARDHRWQRLDHRRCTGHSERRAEHVGNPDVADRTDQLGL